LEKNELERRKEVVVVAKFEALLRNLHEVKRTTRK
jgi:hypothetical protein